MLDNGTTLIEEPKACLLAEQNQQDYQKHKLST